MEPDELGDVVPRFERGTTLWTSAASGSWQLAGVVVEGGEQNEKIVIVTPDRDTITVEQLLEVHGRRGLVADMTGELGADATATDVASLVMRPMNPPDAFPTRCAACRHRQHASGCLVCPSGCF